MSDIEHDPMEDAVHVASAKCDTMYCGPQTPVNVLITLYRNGSTRVNCEHLLEAADGGAQKCGVYGEREGIEHLPDCLYCNGPRGPLNWIEDDDEGENDETEEES